VQGILVDQFKGTEIKPKKIRITGLSTECQIMYLWWLCNDEWMCRQVLAIGW